MDRGHFLSRSLENDALKTQRVIGRPLLVVRRWQDILMQDTNTAAAAASHQRAPAGELLQEHSAVSDVN